MQTITLQIQDDALDRFYWLLEHFKHEIEIIDAEVIASQSDKKAYLKAKKELESNQASTIESIKAKRKAINV